jgi:hypothetical protein
MQFLVQQARRCEATLNSRRARPNHTSRSQFHHSIFAKAGNQGSRKTARRPLHAGKAPNGVRWKNLLRRYRVRRLPEIRFLELAKGFEPPTL